MAYKFDSDGYFCRRWYKQAQETLKAIRTMATLGISTTVLWDCYEVEMKRYWELFWTNCGS